MKNKDGLFLVLPPDITYEELRKIKILAGVPVYKSQYLGELIEEDEPVDNSLDK